MSERRPAPVYLHEPVKVSAGRTGPRGVAVVVERVFFVFGAVFAAWFAVLLVRSGLRLSWWHLLYLVAFWGVASYLALPRLHRVLTEVYVPDYFIGRVRTGDGLLGDPVNLAFHGSAEQIDTAMRAAGWTVADPITLASARRIAVSSVTGRSYPEAPVSSLYLFGRQQDVAFQQEVENSPAKRHHVRFWKCPEGWYLPGGHQVDWLAAGTYDRAVGLSLFTLQVTHKIDADTDAERDYIVATLQHAEPAVAVRTIENFSTGYHHRNGGGDLIQTDGDLPVVDVSGVAVPAAGADSAPVAGPTAGVAAESWVRAVAEQRKAERGVPPRPSVFLVAVAAIAVGAVLSFLRAAPSIARELGNDPDLVLTWGERVAAVGLLALVMALLHVPLLVFMLRGHSWARYLALGTLAVSGLEVMFTPLAELERRGPLEILIIATWIVAVIALSDRAASDWLHAIRADHRARKAARAVS